MVAMSQVELMDYLFESWAELIYGLTKIGFSMKSIDDMEVRVGVWYLTKDFEEKIQDKIDMFSIHGINVRDAKVMGTDWYSRYLDHRTTKRDMEMLATIKKRRNSKTNDGMKGTVVDMSLLRKKTDAEFAREMSRLKKLRGGHGNE